MHAPLTDPQQALPVIIDFVRSLGITVEEGTVEEGSTFLPGIAIRDGRLVYDSTGAFYPGDLLHEAGHLALLGPEKRCRAGGDLTGQFPEEAGSEMAVILWTWLACRHLAISPRVVLHSDGYRDQGDWLSQQFEGGNYIGLPLLEWMGVVRSTSDGPPEVLTWLRD